MRLAINGNPLNYTLRSTRRPNSGSAIFPINLQATQIFNSNSTVTIQWNTSITPVEFRHGSIYMIGIPNS
jgi:Tfp pilus assembly protein PilN